jgi:streptogramin lyase
LIASRRAIVIVVAFGVAFGGGFVLLRAFNRATPVHRPAVALRVSTPVAPISAVPKVSVQERDSIHVGDMTAAIQGLGSVWAAVITDQGQQEILRLDPSSGHVDARYPVNSMAAHEWGGAGIVVGAGSVWAAGAADHQATIFRIDPETGELTRHPLEGHSVSDLAFDGHDLWALVSLEGEHQSAVVQVDPSSGDVLSETPFEADWTGGLFPVSGTAWVLERAVQGDTVEDGSLAQIAPGTSPPVPIGGSFADPVTDGTSIWAAFYGDPTAMNLSHGIARVDPTTGTVLDQWKTDQIGYDLAVGADGGIWFLGGKGLERLNPSTGATDVRQHLDATPIFISPTDDGLWVGTYEGDLIRFQVRASD